MDDDDNDAAIAHAQECERRRLDDDFQHIAKLLDEQRERDHEFQRQSEEWRLRMLSMQDEYFDNAWSELADRINKLGASLWR